ncbi:hypothetical protein M5X00_10515 [Paenibacillus alvei]|uniref:Uncharacterized protein n=1 Tax=Paenibacillus alvei TaxID=44250 RepID=A0ABT4H190_PAEAL|nr:hypothetical protein [Paenibacillus alvei]EJW15163.1 hypothetical protein PAV_9c00860 [Paenibacillus alvei DSM 29]MBG9736889.1 hypothetical protein [Paenibacillus alvei]MBG9746410.1 hypothetical protein [Paenibacillus alvei]MCY9543973.1 hypothetical protein [Paenibacillus alvei]MCY9579265.1 hypothetical protein [Paenibacillus alvei]
MFHFRKLAVGVLSLTFLLSSQMVFAQASDSDIPEDVLEKAKAKESHYQAPEPKAWEIDMDGNRTEVVPLSQRVTTMAPPNDGYKYAFDRYDASRNSKDWNYKSTGTIRVNNALSTSATLSYTQQTTTETTWNVSSAISAKAEVKAGFLAGIEASTSVQVDSTRKWIKGTSYGVGVTVAPKTTAYLTNYAVGVNSNGKLIYKKYASSGSQIGIYEEAIGGTVVSLDDANVELTSTSPM